MTNSANEGVLVSDAKGNIETFSPSAERIFGDSAEEIIGRNIDVLIPERFRAQHRPLFDTFLHAQSQGPNKENREVTGLHRDGTERNLNIALFKIHGRDSIKVTAIIRDLTKSENGRQMLMASNRRLELLLGLSSAVNKASTFGEAIQTCLDKICELTNWPIGHVYYADSTRPKRLVPGDNWRIHEPERFASFRRQTLQ